MTDINGTQLAELTANTLNSSLDDEITAEFVKRMACEHRTLQQNFTRLCAAWLEHLATIDENCYDARNAASVEYAKNAVEANRDTCLPTI